MPIEDTPFDPSEGNPFVGVDPTPRDEIIDEAALRSRNFIDKEDEGASETKSTPSDEKRRRTTILTAGAVVVAAAAAFGAGPEMVETLNGPEISEETTEIAVQNGDSWWNIAERVEGHEHMSTDEVVAVIQSIPSNLDLVTEGLQPGQIVSVPVEIKP